jgi:hypothetical protein
MNNVKYCELLCDTMVTKILPRNPDKKPQPAMFQQAPDIANYNDEKVEVPMEGEPAAKPTPLKQRFLIPMITLGGIFLIGGLAILSSAKGASSFNDFYNSLIAGIFLISLGNLILYHWLPAFVLQIWGNLKDLL